MVSIPLNTETEPQHTGLSSPRNIWYSGRLWRCHKLFELTILCQQHLKDRIGLVLQNFRKHWHCRAIPPILTPTDGQSNLTPIAAHSWHTARAMVPLLTGWRVNPPAAFGEALAGNGISSNIFRAATFPPAQHRGTAGIRSRLSCLSLNEAAAMEPP